MAGALKLYRSHWRGSPYDLQSEKTASRMLLASVEHVSAPTPSWHSRPSRL